jgi:hypothetical protein
VEELNGLVPRQDKNIPRFFDPSPEVSRTTLVIASKSCIKCHGLNYRFKAVELDDNTPSVRGIGGGGGGRFVDNFIGKRGLNRVGIYLNSCVKVV